MECPACDMHHDGPGDYCRDCLLDFRRMLESGKSEVVETVAEWLSSALATRERPEEIECPKCQNEFKI